MYWYAKLILAVIAVLIVGGILFALRSYLPSWPHHQTTPVESAAKPPDEGGNGDVGPVPAPSPPDPHRNVVLQKLAIAQRHVQEDELLTARKLAANILQDPELEPFDELWWNAVDVLSTVNGKLLFSTAPCPEKQVYRVAKGDSLWRIARQHGTTVGMIQKANGLDETNPSIYPGQVLHLYQGNWSIRVSKTHYALLLYDGERLVKVYRVGLGRQDRTPLGTFTIDTKQTEPAWTPPGRHIPFGDPENVLGTRWLGLQPTEGTDTALVGYGIHGTWQPDTVGQDASNGCVRMANADVEELFDIVPEGTRVVIEN